MRNGLTLGIGEPSARLATKMTYVSEFSNHYTLVYL
jgi:hypothetical protein